MRATQLARSPAGKRPRRSTKRRTPARASKSSRGQPARCSYPHPSAPDDTRAGRYRVRFLWRGAPEALPERTDLSKVGRRALGGGWPSGRRWSLVFGRLPPVGRRSVMGRSLVGRWSAVFAVVVPPATAFKRGSASESPPVRPHPRTHNRRPAATAGGRRRLGWHPSRPTSC